MSSDADRITQALTSVTKTWTRQRKAEEREQARALRRYEAVTRRSRLVTIADACYFNMEAAYLKASGNGALPAGARQIMYAIRPLVEEETGRQLDDQYFCQTILPQYLADNPAQTGDWDIVWDARGRLREPHTGREVALGTIGVRHYLADIDIPASTAVEMPIFATDTYPTCGPGNRYSAILFVEKEGFDSILQRAQLAERFDLAVMSTKGMSVTASRTLVERLCADGGVPLLVLHDFDKAGFSIVATLQRDTRRYSFENHPYVVDLGLRLVDVERHQLAPEPVSYRSDPRRNLRENGADDDEIEFLADVESWRGSWRGHRVELNSFTSDNFVAWIETKLREHGIAKVVPDNATIEQAYRRARERILLNELITTSGTAIRVQTEQERLPANLVARVRDELTANSHLAWDDVIAAIASHPAESE